MLQRKWAKLLPQLPSLPLLGILVLFLSLLEPRLLQGAEPAKQTAKVIPSIPVERLLPARTVFLWFDEGVDAHQAGYDQTAANDALSKTGVFLTCQQFVDAYVSLLETADPESVALKETIGEVIGAIRSVSHKGFAISVNLPEEPGFQIPQLTVVLPQGGSLAKTLFKLSTTKFVAEAPPMPVVQAAGAHPERAEDEHQEQPPSAAPETQAPVTQAAVTQAPVTQTEVKQAADQNTPAVAKFIWTKTQIGSRDIYRREVEDQAGLDLAFWEEQGHFVFVLGFGSIQQTLAVADGKAQNLTANRIWNELHQGARNFDRRSYGWVDVKELRIAYDETPLGQLSLEGEVWQELSSILESVLESLFSSVSDTSDHHRGVVIDASNLNSAVAAIACTDEPLPAKAANSEQAAPPAAVAQAPQSTVMLKQLIIDLGLENVQHYTWQSGYKGRALWKESFLSVPGPKTGILAFVEQPTIQFDQLPPLPADVALFSALSVDLKHVGQSAKQLIRNLGPTLSGLPADAFEKEYLRWKIGNGSIVKDIVAGLDPLVCVYNDQSNGPLKVGPVLVWKVRDAARLRKGLEDWVGILTEPSENQIAADEAKQTDEKDHSQDTAREPDAATKPVTPRRPETLPKTLPKLQGNASRTVPANPEPAGKQPDGKQEVERIGVDIEVPAKLPAVENAGPSVVKHNIKLELKVVKKTRHGRELVGIQSNGNPLGIVYTVDDNWLAVSLNSQLLEAFLLRVDGKLPRWKSTTAQEDAMRELPDQFTSISMADPRKSVPTLVSLGYCGLSWLETICQNVATQSRSKKALKNLPHLPPAELVIEPLFPNVAVTTVDATGIHTCSRSSLPSASYAIYVTGYYLFAELCDLEDLLSF